MLSLLTPVSMTSASLLPRLPGVLALIGMALLSLPARAQTLPFFLPAPKINTGAWYVAHGWANSAIQSCEWRKEALSEHDGNLRITLSDNGGSVRPHGCGELQSRNTYGYGTYTARIRAARGSGLNTAFFTYLGRNQGFDGHDEIDFEFLGRDTTRVQLNYYIDGKPLGTRLIDLGFDAAEAFHEYSFVWQPDRIRWYVDRKLVHETPGGAAIPSHPGKIFVTLWSGSDKVKDWLGPFAYTGDVTAEFAWVKYTALH